MKTVTPGMSPIAVVVRNRPGADAGQGGGVVDQRVGERQEADPHQAPEAAPGDDPLHLLQPVAGEVEHEVPPQPPAQK